jgi:AcrR family transcriptional regulator
VTARLRTRLDMDARRAQLLELGLRLFADRSYEDVSIEDIAAAAGVSKGLLYHYFGGKRELYVAVVDLAARRLLDAIVPDPQLPLVQRPLAGLDAYLSFVDAHRESFSALINGGLGADPQIAAIVDHAREAIIGRIMLEIGLRTPRPIFRASLRAWIGGVEAASIEWLARGAVPRPALLMLLMSSLYAAVTSAAVLDPEAGVEPQPPDPILPLSRVFGRGAATT